MPENIVKKIKKTELEAEKIIEAARRKAVAKINKANEKAEKSAKDFEGTSAGRLKDFRENISSVYRSEAQKIKEEGKKTKADYIKEIEKKLPSIKEKVSELIRKELCL